MSALWYPKQERFCHEYVKDLDGRAAALRAGFSPSRHICETVLRLLKDARVRVRVAELQEAIATDYPETRSVDVGKGNATSARDCYQGGDRQQSSD